MDPRNLRRYKKKCWVGGWGGHRAYFSSSFGVFVFTERHSRLRDGLNRKASAPSMGNWLWVTRPRSTRPPSPREHCCLDWRNNDIHFPANHGPLWAGVCGWGQIACPSSCDTASDAEGSAEGSQLEEKKRVKHMQEQGYNGKPVWFWPCRGWLAGAESSWSKTQIYMEAYGARAD